MYIVYITYIFNFIIIKQRKIIIINASLHCEYNLKKNGLTIKTIHIIARTQFTICDWFPDSPSFPVAEPTTPSIDAPARPLLRVSFSDIQPTLVASRYIPSWFCMVQFNQITTLTVNNYHIHINNNAMIIISVYQVNYTNHEYRACHPTSSMPTMAVTL